MEEAFRKELKPTGGGGAFALVLKVVPWPTPRTPACSR